MTKPKMIVLDLDGTTLNNSKIIDPALAEYIQKLRRNGVLVCIATGRTIYEMDYALPREFEVDGIINSNGMSVRFGGKEVSRHSIHPSTVEKLISTSIERGIHHEIHHHDGHTSAKISPLRDLANELTGHGYFQPVWTEEIETAEVEKILFFKSDVEAIANWMVELTELEKEYSFNAAISSPDLIDISGKLITKATGANEILDRVGLEFFDIIAFGDGGNDLPLFKRAGRSVAMQNSPDWVKSQATEVTEFSNNENGLLLHLQSIYGKL